MTKKWTAYAFMMILIYCAGALWFNTIGAAYRYAILLCMTLFIVFKNKKGMVTVSNNEGVIVLILIGMILLSCSFNRSFYSIDIILILYWILAVIVCGMFTFESFVENFTKCMAFIAVSSTVLFVAYWLFPGWISILPTFTEKTWTTGLTVRNALVCVFDPGSSNYKRNWAIFYEPGMCAFYFSFALFLEMFYNKKSNIKTMLFLFIGVLSTLSTTGYISLLFLLGAFISNKATDGIDKERMKKYKKTFKKVVVAAIVFLAFFFVSHPNNWKFLTYKLYELISDSTGGSGYERKLAIIYAMEAIKSNPMTGLSALPLYNLSAGKIQTFTPLNWFSSYGLIYGLTCNSLFFGLARIGRCSSAKVFAFMFLLILGCTQSIGNNPIILIAMLYSVRNWSKEGKVQ